MPLKRVLVDVSVLFFAGERYDVQKCTNELPEYTRQYCWFGTAIPEVVRPRRFLGVSADPAQSVVATVKISRLD